MAAKKKVKFNAQETTLRHLWLVGLGVIAVARRETLNAANDAAAKLGSLTTQAGKLASDAQANVLGGIANVREQGEAKASRFSADVEARLAPVLVKLGLKPKAKKTARGRKLAKKVVTKCARAKPVAKRVVRKSRG